MECTEAQKVQISIEFEFYRDLWNEELDVFFAAFIQHHNIFGVSDSEPKELTAEELKQIERMMAMGKGMQNKTMNPLLEAAV